MVIGFTLSWVLLCSCLCFQICGNCKRQPAQNFTHYAVKNIGLFVDGVPYMPHMTKMASLVSESIEALDATGKQSTVFFILYVHKMYSPSLGIKLQEEVTYCISYISEKSVHRLFIQFMVLILPIPTRHITNYDRQHLDICMTWW